MREDAVDDRLLDVRPQRAGDLGAAPVDIVALAREPVLALRCRFARRRRGMQHVVDGDLDAHVEGLRCARGDDVDGGGAPEKTGDLVDGPHRRGQADPLRRVIQQGVEALQAHGEMCAPFGGRHRVHLVDDDGVHLAQGLLRLAGEHEVQRLGSRDEDVRRLGEQLPPVGGGGVAGAHTHGDVGGGQAQPPRGLPDADEW